MLQRQSIYLPLSDLKPWEQSGAISLPKSDGATPFSDDYEIVALVYQFNIEEKLDSKNEKERRGKQVELEPRDPQLHLARSGIAVRL